MCEQWKVKVPLTYRGTNPDLLSPALLKDVLNWTPGPTGLIIYGPSGTGKTRAIYELMKVVHFEHRLEWMVFGGGAFGDECAQHYAVGDGPEWIRGPISAPVLVFEDLAKEKLTDRVSDAFYRIVEARTARHRPIIAACNCSPRGLAKRLGGDRGEPIVRRLNEYCTSIRVGHDDSGATVVVSITDPSEMIKVTLARLKEDDEGTLLAPGLKQMRAELKDLKRSMRSDKDNIDIMADVDNYA